MASVGTIKYKSGSSWIDVLHPVGSFHLSTSSTSPATLFGGTWVQVTDAALRGATSTGYTGSDTHTLTVDEMPSHGHLMGDYWHTATTANVANGTYYGLRHEQFSTASTGGGASTLYRATLLQPLRLVQNSVTPRVVMDYA